MKYTDTIVTAVQVTRPYRAFKKAFPRHHEFKSVTGRLSHFYVSDTIGRSQAYPGDWVVKFEDGSVEIFTDEEFTRRYKEA